MSNEIEKHIEQQLKEFGAATVQMSDGRLIVLSVKTLEMLLARAKEKDTDRSAIFIQAPVEAPDETIIDLTDEWKS